MKRVAVVGGGASGMAAAIAAAMEGASVTVIERNDRFGKKLLGTGNGRCNLGNTTVSEAAYYGNSQDLLQKCLRIFTPSNTIRFFDRMGLVLWEKEQLLYPYSMQASMVADVLQMEMDSLGISIQRSSKVESIQALDEGFSLVVQKREGGKTSFFFDAVIVACGGMTYPQSGSDGSGYVLAQKLGHTITPLFPALVPLVCEDSYCKLLSGVRAYARVHIYEAERELAWEEGEIQFTEYGLSGIPIFQVSHLVCERLHTYQSDARSKDLTAWIDFLPQWEEEALESWLSQRLLLLGERKEEDFFCGLLHQKVMHTILRVAKGTENPRNVKAGEQTKKKVNREKDSIFERYRQILNLCRAFPFHIVGSKGWEQAQVTAGGVRAEEVSDTLESRLHPGLYFVGEMLDVDGICGGYNLHWAWCSGTIAGKASATK
jgi:predicted Rossmann fold flavoprotein